MMCLLQSLLEVRAAIFAGVSHKVDNRAVVALNDDASAWAASGQG